MPDMSVKPEVAAERYIQLLERFVGSWRIEM